MNSLYSSYFDNHRLKKEESCSGIWVSNKNWNGEEKTRTMKGLSPRQEWGIMIDYNLFQKAVSILKSSDIRLLGEGAPSFFDSRYISREGVEITYTIPHTIGERALEAITLRLFLQ